MAETKIRIINSSSLKKETKAKTPKPAKKLVKVTAKAESTEKTSLGAKLAGLKIFKPFKKLADFISGAFGELRQVHWPNRKTSIGLTLAVLIFSAVFVVIIILLDFGFEKLFELIIKKS